VTAEPEVDPVIVAYYNEGRERGRLAAGPSQLERLRTQALLSRFLPAPPARVLDVGGAAAISRYASFMDGFYREFVDRPGFAAGMADTMRTGRHLNPRREQYMFTTAYFHDRDGLAAEVTDAGLSLEAIMPVEGPLAWAPGLEGRLAEPAQRQLILDSLAAIEHDPAITGASSHLLAIARASPLARGLALDGQGQEVGHGEQPEGVALQRPDAAAGLIVVDARTAGPE
jgi:hypothetical protein